MKRLVLYGFSIFLVIGIGFGLFLPNTETYMDSDIGFSISYPAGWKNTAVKGGNIAVLFTGGQFNRNVQVLYDEGGEEGGKTALDRLAKILPAQKELTAEWRKVNGRRSFFQVVEWSSPLGSNRAIRLMVPAGDHYFLVMAVCPAGEFESLRPLLTQCVLSFKATH